MKRLLPFPFTIAGTVVTLGVALAVATNVDLIHVPLGPIAQRSVDDVAIALLLLAAGLTVDVTRAKRAAAEHARRAAVQAEREFRALFAANPLPMWIYDLATLQFLEVNTAAIEHYGYTRDEFLGMTIKDIRPAEDVAVLVHLRAMSIIGRNVLCLVLSLSTVFLVWIPTASAQTAT